MSAASILAYIGIVQQAQLVDYFRSQRALNPESAIELNLDELSSLLNRQFSEKEIYGYPFIERVVDQNKYYLNEQALKRDETIIKLALLLLGVGTLIIFSYLFINLKNLLI